MKPKYRLTLVKSPKNKEYFWRIVHRNGKEICRSSETYKRRIDCATAAQRLFTAMTQGDYEVPKDGSAQE